MKPNSGPPAISPKDSACPSVERTVARVEGDRPRLAHAVRSGHVATRTQRVTHAAISASQKTEAKAKTSVEMAVTAVNAKRICTMRLDVCNVGERRTSEVTTAAPMNDPA